MPWDSVLIIADIEGCSGCWDYDGSRFLTTAWYKACVAMSRDINAVATALFQAGVNTVVVQDFHRTGYNILPELLDRRIQLRSGYRIGPVLGMGIPPKAEAVMYVGMHAASGTKGFLAHTLTSRISCLTVNGRPLPEVELFSAALAPYGMRSIFFSGCPVACDQAKAVFPGLTAYAIDKSIGAYAFNQHAWRKGLAESAVRSLGNATDLYDPKGPFEVRATMRDGCDEAAKLGRRWGFDTDGAVILWHAPDMLALFRDLVRMCYLTPVAEKWAPFLLFCHRFLGRFGLEMVRRHWKRQRMDL